MIKMLLNLHQFMHQSMHQSNSSIKPIDPYSSCGFMHSFLHQIIRTCNYVGSSSCVFIGFMINATQYASIHASINPLFKPICINPCINQPINQTHLSNVPAADSCINFRIKSSELAIMWEAIVSCWIHHHASHASTHPSGCEFVLDLLHRSS
jgi:hypothetical protein